jgi:hypothetical protein
VTDKPWNASHINIGEAVHQYLYGFDISVEHLDRRLDPFGATVIRDGVVLFTGLFPTLSAARQWCEQKVRERS